MAGELTPAHTGVRKSGRKRNKTRMCLILNFSCLVQSDPNMESVAANVTQLIVIVNALYHINSLW